MDKQRLIRDLVDDLAPVPRLAGVGTSLTLWLLASWILIGGAMLLTGPLRPGVGGQLSDSPRFAKCSYWLVEMTQNTVKENCIKGRLREFEIGGISDVKANVVDPALLSEGAGTDYLLLRDVDADHLSGGDRLRKPDRDSSRPASAIEQPHTR